MMYGTSQDIGNATTYDANDAEYMAAMYGKNQQKGGMPVLMTAVSEAPVSSVPPVAGDGVLQPAFSMPQDALKLEDKSFTHAGAFERGHK
jgi:hypothetical protein